MNSSVPKKFSNTILTFSIFSKLSNLVSYVLVYSGILLFIVVGFMKGKYIVTGISFYGFYYFVGYYY